MRLSKPASRALLSVLCLLGAPLFSCSSASPRAGGASTAVPATSPLEGPLAVHGEVPELQAPEAFAEQHGRFEDYWYQGLAELSRYRLTQSRYGAPREGEAVLIFVTEDFLPGPQVKHEQGEHPEALSVLKLNAYRRFYTGIYPYTLMTSSFLPARDPAAAALKVSSTVQEWCGHAYTQLNRREDGLHLSLHSYFQAEADQEEVLEEAPLEDAVWARIRRDPSALPAGELRMVPALHALRFAHQPVRPYPARASLEDVRDPALSERPLRRYSVQYSGLDRILRITFEAGFPHAILAWEETVRSGAEAETTRAVRTHAAMTDYWSHNGPDDDGYRAALGLQM